MTPPNRYHIHEHYNLSGTDVYYTSPTNEPCTLGGLEVEITCKTERDLYVVKPDGTDGGYLTFAPDTTDAASWANVDNYVFEFPSWSWDQTKLIATNTRNDQLYRSVDVATGDATTLGIPGATTPVAWTAGGQVVYGSAQSGTRYIFLADPDGSNAVRLTSTQGGELPIHAFLPEPIPDLPDEQTFGDELADNPTGEMDEVNTLTGAYAYHAVDVALPGIDVPFELKRSYNSLDTSTGALGTGWQWSFGAKLTLQFGGNVLARAGDGQQLLFVKQADGSFSPYSGGTAKLALVGGAYELTTDLQKTYVFPVTNGYVSIPHVALEAGGLGAAGYGIYEWGR